MLMDKVGGSTRDEGSTRLSRLPGPLCWLTDVGELAKLTALRREDSGEDEAGYLVTVAAKMVSPPMLPSQCLRTRYFPCFLRLDVLNSRTTVRFGGLYTFLAGPEQTTSPKGKFILVHPNLSSAAREELADLNVFVHEICHENALVTIYTMDHGDIQLETCTTKHSQSWWTWPRVTGSSAQQRQRTLRGSGRLCEAWCGVLTFDAPPVA